MENTKKRITLTLNDFELNLLDSLEKKSGYTANELMRMGLRLIYKQENPKRQGRPKKEETSPLKMQTEYKMPPETHCISVLNGEVVEIDGVQCCKYQLGACEITDPLASLKVQ